MPRLRSASCVRDEFLALQIHWRDVDDDAQWADVRLLRDALCRALQRKAGDARQQAAAFHFRHERTGAHGAPFRMCPAYQRLDARHAARGDLDHGLIRDMQLPMPERAAHG